MAHLCFLGLVGTGQVVAVLHDEMLYSKLKLYIFLLECFNHMSKREHELMNFMYVLVLLLSV